MTQLETTNEIENLFASMLNRYEGKELTQPAGTIQSNDGPINQDYFIRPSDTLIPDMGARLVGEKGTLSYYLNFYEAGRLNERAWVAEGRVNSDFAGGNFNMVGEAVGALGLSLQYDPGITQAAANHYQTRVLNSLEVELDMTELRNRLRLQGYQTMKGQPQYMEKVYLPQR